MKIKTLICTTLAAGLFAGCCSEKAEKHANKQAKLMAEVLARTASIRRAASPSTWLAKCGTRSQGRIRNRVLFAIPANPSARSAELQPR